MKVLDADSLIDGPGSVKTVSAFTIDTNVPNRAGADLTSR